MDVVLFYQAVWTDLADAGEVDAVFSAEYRRVWFAWVSANYKRPLIPFIKWNTLPPLPEAPSAEGGGA